MIVTGGSECIYNEYGQIIVRIKLDEYDLYEAAQEYNETAKGIPPNRTGDDDWDYFLCPSCGKFVMGLDDTYLFRANHVFCSKCGCKIDVSSCMQGEIIKEKRNGE